MVFHTKFAMFFLRILVLFSLFYFTHAVDKKPAKKVLDAEDYASQFIKLNLTKRPLNLYITANGKHVSVLNKTVSNHEKQQSDIVDYRVGYPPFLIKNRGTVVLLHNLSAEANSLDWHQGYPSMVQMLAASGHTTIALELLKAPSLSANHLDRLSANVNLLEKVLAAENITEDGLVLLAHGPQAWAILNEFSKKWQNQVHIDAFVVIESEKSMDELDSLKGKSPVTPVLTLQQNTPTMNAVGKKSVIKVVELDDSHALQNRFQLAQVVVNFWIGFILDDECLIG
uniref:Uncharacterized protein n=1 Tax=Ditylenchus dipsaci TaxID=166011 RepID=A0A915DHZ0_9BILA